ncbi:glycosyltransferase [Flavobacterium algoritolerans]|uniref:Glycosyltransferase n=1 Tax=Flavobacterium algoritolerans TaxID=3041254 RepID=A0ABT6VBJ5_9FLAO|nr:glycosyltransferase [Flavobacterium algoritolerans]MDI5895618.1 glycosyltransferase [Flavobacterium algoritolerans]
MQPLISVILPVYNASKFLAEAIDSILAQDFQNFELLIINDGSTDDSQLIINGYSDKRIRVFEKSNGGLIDTLAFGIERSDSLWIARMDADDVALPKRFEIQFQSIADDVAVIGTQASLINEDGVEYGRTKFALNHKDIVVQLENLSSSIIHPSVLINKKMLEKAGGYDPKMHIAEDFDLWLRISKIGKIINIDQPLLKLRKHGSNISATKLDIATDNCLISLAYHYKINSLVIMPEEFYHTVSKKIAMWSKSYKKNVIEWERGKNEIGNNGSFGKIIYLTMHPNLIVNYARIFLSKKKLLDKIKYT